MQAPPAQRDPIASSDGRVTNPWQWWFAEVARQVDAAGGSSEDLADDIEAICRALGSPDGTPGNIPDDAGAGELFGQGSIRVLGQLSDGRAWVGLAGDTDEPGFTYCYGTDSLGDKGWFPISDALAATSDITLTVGADGISTIGLADITPTAGGTLQKTAFDAKGRRSQEAAATTDDLAEGAGNLYYTDVRADARITAQKGVAGGLATLDASSKLDSGQLPALAITETFVVADEAAMLALTCEQGDVAVRTDISTSFILTAEPASTLSNWQELLSPTAGAVTSFNGRTGAVMPASGDYTAAQVGADPAGTAAAIVTQTITNGDTTHAPSGDAVFDALAGKFDKAGGTITGNLTVQTGAVGQVIVDVPAATVADFLFREGGSTKWLLRKNSSNDFEFTAFGGGGVAFIVPHSTANLWPGGADNTKDLGGAARRWKELFCANATINTSDAREKTAPRDLTDAELAAAADLACLPSIFQWLHAIEEKGEAARLHCSPTVQSVIAIMESHGLDPFRYGFVCYDEWPERVEPAEYETVETVPAVTIDHPAIYERAQVYTEDGQPERFADRLVSPPWTEVVTPAVTEERLVRPEATHPAGNRYSLRPSELAHFVMRGLAHRQDQLEARLAALEG